MTITTLIEMPTVPVAATGAMPEVRGGSGDYDTGRQRRQSGLQREFTLRRVFPDKSATVRAALTAAFPDCLRNDRRRCFPSKEDQLRREVVHQTATGESALDDAGVDCSVVRNDADPATSQSQSLQGVENMRTGQQLQRGKLDIAQCATDVEK